jgi:hypothetical protein
MARHDDRWAGGWDRVDAADLDPPPGGVEELDHRREALGEARVHSIRIEALGRLEKADEIPERPEALEQVRAVSEKADIT